MRRPRPPSARSSTTWQPNRSTPSELDADGWAVAERKTSYDVALAGEQPQQCQALHHLEVVPIHSLDIGTEGAGELVDVEATDRRCMAADELDRLSLQR